MEAHIASCLDPFAADTGAEVIYVEGPVSLGFLKADVEAPGDPTFDTMKIGTQDMPSAIEQELIQKIDFSVINLDDLTPFQYENEYAVQHSTFGAAVFYNTDKWPDGGPVPETWADTGTPRPSRDPEVLTV